MKFPVLYGSGPQIWPFSWKTIVPWTRGGGNGLGMTQAHYICGAFFFCYYYISSSSGIRFWRLGIPALWEKEEWGVRACSSQEKLSPSCRLRLEGHSNQEDVWMQCRIPAAPSDCLHEKWGPTRSQKRSQALHKLEVWCGSAKVKGREGAMHVLFCPFSWLAPSRMSSL